MKKSSTCYIKSLKIIAMGAHFFNKHAQEGNIFLSDLAKELGEPDNLQKAERILKVVMHTLRDRITLEESFQFTAQLPLFLKEVYVSEWKYRKSPVKIKHINEFIETAKMKALGTVSQDFAHDESAVLAVKSVFKVLGRYVSAGICFRRGMAGYIRQFA
ncbi:DUF2267 domain-containing protein [Catalinimonas niigatensis]|uniref:DUF2267 domain-containing protein n=1 Tax=Catalinimonas niigatensis TaxID=1397264 RepID=UPI002665CC60|nr:DUF2267 domain-containing protein [Catalinimonas niigatensis]WPP49795.1 DUF2267 domain-containing protein [Catalinimonas niigatensis]